MYIPFSSASVKRLPWYVKCESRSEKWNESPSLHSLETERRFIGELLFRLAVIIIGSID